MHPLPRASCALLLAQLAACGRFGFSSLEIDASEARPSSRAPIHAWDAGAEEGRATDSGLPSLADGSTDAAQEVAPDAGAAPDAGPDAAIVPLGCSLAPSDVVWCADFDLDYPPNSLVDTWRGETALVTSPSFRGSALQARTFRSRGYAAVVGDLGAFAPPTLYARGHVLLSSDPIDDLTVFHVGNWGESFGGVDVDITRGKLETYYYADDSVVESGFAVPRDRWFCLQIRINLAETGGSVSVSLDGEQIVDARDVTTLPPEGLTDFVAGLPWTGPNQPDVSVFVDEVAVGPSPIPCLSSP